VRLAEDNGFRLVDVRVTYDKHLRSAPLFGDGDCQAIIRPYVQDDIPMLRAIARASYHLTRFYYDLHFPRHLCDALYETWIEKSCNGYANTVLVAEIQGQAAGYITWHLLGRSTGQIGLIGVGSDWQGMGLGQELLHAALHWLAERGMTHAAVVTQGRNCQAQRLYGRCGFLVKSVQLWYHRWFLSRGATNV
jgi:dTDP-4-amino-4,6-dideoxy-D-galactose acyltransferase